MSTIFLTKLYNIFVKNLGKETADCLLNFIDYKFKQDMENKSQNFATKEDLYKTKVDLIKWFITLWIAQALMIMGLYFKK